jgi:ABC-type uncharacterized transport system permease subunit
VSERRGHVDVGFTGALVVLGVSAAVIELGTQRCWWAGFSTWSLPVRAGAFVVGVVVLVLGAQWESSRRWKK